MAYDSIYSGINEKRLNYFTLFPNPASSLLTIDFQTEVHQNRCLEVYDISENKIFETQALQRKIILNVENYSKGLYFIKVRSNRSIYVGKFCKE
jgi:hypothetical protein